MVTCKLAKELTESLRTIPRSYLAFIDIKSGARFSALYTFRRFDQSCVKLSKSLKVALADGNFRLFYWSMVQYCSKLDTNESLEVSSL